MFFEVVVLNFWWSGYWSGICQKSSDSRATLASALILCYAPASHMPRLLLFGCLLLFVLCWVGLGVVVVVVVVVMVVVVAVPSCCLLQELFPC